ncbi:MAG: hypothetical protein NC342_01920 [Pseudoflavonifractor sp.]|nr:hypothetical protein [Alloprevotella sp.]MCM1116281.1 hypothetical protein [Pseudoflavonifractor sp.]
MKLILLNRRPSQPLPPFADAAIIPDSAIVNQGRPLFVPDFAGEFTAELLPALRVSRLGKGMSERFATRYVDAITLLLRLCPPPVYTGGLASAFDNCIMQGQWLPIEEIDLTQPLTIQATDGFSQTLLPGELLPFKAIATIGSLMTIRTGDIIAPATLATPYHLAPGLTIEAALNGHPCLKARLK